VVSRGLIQKKELIVYKLILDHYEAIYSHKMKAGLAKAGDLELYEKKLIPCQYSLYQQIQEPEIEGLLD